MLVKECCFVFFFPCQKRFNLSILSHRLCEKFSFGSTIPKTSRNIQSGFPFEFSIWNVFQKAKFNKNGTWRAHPPLPRPRLCRVYNMQTCQRNLQPFMYWYFPNAFESCQSAFMCSRSVSITRAPAEVYGCVCSAPACAFTWVQLDYPHAVLAVCPCFGL